MAEIVKVEMLTPYKDEAIRKFIWKAGDVMDMKNGKVFCEELNKWYELPRHSEGEVWKFVK